MKSLTWTCAVAMLVSAGAVQAHGETKDLAKRFDPATAEQQPFGIAGDPKRATRTMTIAMSDRMHFLPSVLTIRKGETVRFVVRNEGKLLHELVLGTEDELKKHAAEMRKFPDMEHDEPHMVHVKPGSSGDLVWTFNRAGEFEFACLVGGHYEAGMKGRIIVK
jgi:uncharacterized cupredoxin-like copper-binding protein